ncbi:hypothetical protein SAMN05216188_118100 [Lentzea xinjiangensis]|uniref:Uncharacterized protein n=1 Tax=Lentzea xinjiangensis TaxID=402600 RepID=A0A1H9TFZ0_9PSEU|nr:hypothetical protein [Lentzea xinjiangensis]SER96122.1 hypothetical protein SAMN05216188_118100 [Lentzea xinjiangensis]
MTIADAASALVARGFAAGNHLGRFTIEFHDDLDVPAVVDPETNTIWLRKGDPLEDAIFVLYACFDKLTGGTVVQAENGELDVVADVAVGAEGLALPGLPRPQLRIVK